MLRFGIGSEKRQGLTTLLQEVVTAAGVYPTIKRVLVWGSFVTEKLEPNDLDYSLVISDEHRAVIVAEPHARFLVPIKARMHYGADSGFLVFSDYPLDYYAERLDFLCHKLSREVGIIEICLRDERSWES